MSEKHPECPLYNPLNCKEYYNPKLCAFVRKDKECLKKKKPKSRAKTKSKYRSRPLGCPRNGRCGRFRLFPLSM